MSKLHVILSLLFLVNGKVRKRRTKRNKKKKEKKKTSKEEITEEITEKYEVCSKE